MLWIIAFDFNVEGPLRIHVSWCVWKWQQQEDAWNADKAWEKKIEKRWNEGWNEYSRENEQPTPKPTHDDLIFCKVKCKLPIYSVLVIMRWWAFSFWKMRLLRWGFTKRFLSHFNILTTCHRSWSCKTIIFLWVKMLKNNGFSKNNAQYWVKIM